MDETYTSLPTSHLLGSVPAVTNEGKNTANYEVPEANLQIFPPTNGGDRGKGYQTLGSSSVQCTLVSFLHLQSQQSTLDGTTTYLYISEHLAEENGQQSTNNWNGFFNISSYTQYFNVDTDVVLNRLISSLNPTGGDFFSKIDANPDLYGLIWISTTLVFVLASLGNCAAYLTEKKSASSTSWSFDVSYFNVAACAVYIYAAVVPLGFYFLLQYLSSNAKLVHFWCMWGYSLFVFVLSSFLLVIPVEILRWIIIIITGGASACFVAVNIRSHIPGNDLAVVVLAAFVLQLGLALFIKIWFFT